MTKLFASTEVICLIFLIICQFCPKRKNDQRSQGHFFYFARSGKITCPVSITEKMLSKLPDNPVQPLVCRLSPEGTALQHSISYSRDREIFPRDYKNFCQRC